MTDNVWAEVHAKKTTDEMVEAALSLVCRLCGDRERRHWRMSIPPQWDDSDALLSGTIRRLRDERDAAVKRAEAAEGERDEARRDLNCQIEHEASLLTYGQNQEQRARAVEKELEATKRELQAMTQEARAAEVIGRALNEQLQAAESEKQALTVRMAEAETKWLKGISLPGQVGEAERLPDGGVTLQIDLAAMDRAHSLPFTMDPVGTTFPKGSEFEVITKPPDQPSRRDRIIAAATKQLDRMFMGSAYRDNVAEAIADAIEVAMGSQEGDHG